MKKNYKMISVLLSVVLMISLTSSTAFAKKVKPAAPAIDLEVTAGFNDDKESDGYAEVGETITFNYTVINTGTADLTDVAVTDNIDLGVSIGTLAIGETVTRTASYILTAADLEDEIFVYNATVTGDAGELNATDTDSINLQLNLLEFADINLDVVGVLADTNGDGVDSADDIMTYTYTVTNTGTEDLTNIILSDNGTIFAEDYLLTAALAAGAFIDYTPTTTYTLTLADIANKSVSYSATVTALYDDGIETNDPADSSVTKTDTFIYEFGSTPVTGDAVQKLTSPVNNLSTPAIFTDEVPLFYQKVWRDVDLDNVIDGNELFLLEDDLGEIIPIIAVESLGDPYVGDYQLQVDPPTWTEPSVFQTYIVQQVDGVWTTVDLVNNDSWDEALGAYTILIPDGKPDLTEPWLMWESDTTGFLPEHAPFNPQAWAFTDEALALPAAPEVVDTEGDATFDPYCLLDNMLWNVYPPEGATLISTSTPLLLSDATNDFYANAWQADWGHVDDIFVDDLGAPEVTSDNPLKIDFIDWGNPLENTYPLVGYRFPIELYLYAKLPADNTMTGYKMTCLENPHSATELYATGTNIPAYATQDSATVGDYTFVNDHTGSYTFESQYATVLTTQFYCEVEAPNGSTKRVDLEPAIGPSGKMNFASAGGGWVPEVKGTHRIYFYVSDPLISFENAICNNDEHYVFSLGLKAEELSSNTQDVTYIVGKASYTWIDVEVKLPNSNGGRK